VLSKSDNVTFILLTHIAILKLELQILTAIRAQKNNDASATPNRQHRKNRYENMPFPDAPGSKHERTDVSKRKIVLNSLPESVTLQLEEYPARGEEHAGMPAPSKLGSPRVY
jgi:hypothetical protein